MLSTTDDTADTSDMADLVSVDSSGGDSVVLVIGSFFSFCRLVLAVTGYLQLAPPISPSPDSFFR